MTKQLECEVDTREGCNVMILDKLKSHFGKVSLQPASDKMIACNDNPVEVKGPVLSMYKVGR